MTSDLPTIYEACHPAFTYRKVPGQTIVHPPEDGWHEVAVQIESSNASCYHARTVKGWAHVRGGRLINLTVVPRCAQDHMVRRERRVGGEWVDMDAEEADHE